MRNIDPEVVEEFGENRICTLLETDLAGEVPPARIHAAHAMEEGAEGGAVVVKVDRQFHDPGLGWWKCSVEVEIDQGSMSDRELSRAWRGVETVLGDGVDAPPVEDRLRDGRLAVMGGSAYYVEETEVDPVERLRFFRMEITMGVKPPTP